jgi:tRNA(Arg) A34 adenosine deaminase TadA
MCLGAIYWARLSRVYFANVGADASKIGFDDSRIYREIAKPPSQRKIPMIQMMREEALQAFHAWENKPNKIEY